jgi:THO complex subunit 4
VNFDLLHDLTWQQYDRSGRSTGEAIVSFENAVEATRAKKQFNGILAKGNCHCHILAFFEFMLPILGQPMSVAYYIAPRAPRRTVSSPSVTTRSLLNRVEKPPLSDRLGNEDSKPPSGPWVYISWMLSTY